MNTYVRRMVTLAVTAIALSTLAPAVASATNLWRLGNGAWIHQHTRTFRIYPQFSDAGWNTYADLSRGFWDTYTILDIKRTTCHDCAGMHEIEGYYGQTGWLGLATAYAVDNAGHYSHGHAQYNHSYSSQVFQATACQEQGHLLGLDHTDNGGCMAAGYFTLWAPYPQQDDYNTIDATYPATGH